MAAYTPQLLEALPWISQVTDRHSRLRRSISVPQCWLQSGYLAHNGRPR
jgi:hypothetical protein